MTPKQFFLYVLGITAGYIAVKILATLLHAL